MRFYLLALTASALVVIAAPGWAQQSVQDFNWRFSAEFEEEVERTEEVQDGRRYLFIEHANVGSPRRQITIVQWFPAGQRFANIAAALDEFTMPDSDSEIIRSTPLSLNGAVGREVVYRREGYIHAPGDLIDVTRVFIRDNMIYSVDATYREGSSPDSAERFVRSFRLL